MTEGSISAKTPVGKWQQSSHPDTVDLSPWHWRNSATSPFQQIFLPPRIRVATWSGPTNGFLHPTTRLQERKRRENLGTRLTWTLKATSKTDFLCIFLVEGKLNWYERLLDGFVILLLWLWMCKWICRARPHWKKKSTQAKLKKHKRFLIFLCCVLLFMQGYTAWTPILILSFSVLMHTT